MKVDLYGQGWTAHTSGSLFSWESIV